MPIRDESSGTVEKPQEASANSAAAERFLEEKHIGERIKRLRLKRSLGLVELGQLTGLSASFLSQIETGRVMPTLRNLARIALAFGKDLNYFFESDKRPLFRIHRRHDRVRKPQTGAEDPAYYFESLGYLVPERQMDPYLAEFLPKRRNTQESRPHVHAGHEFLYLLSGELELVHNGEPILLEAGDSAYFDAGQPHAYHCVGTSSATALVVTMHPDGGANRGIPIGSMSNGSGNGNHALKPAYE